MKYSWLSDGTKVASVQDDGDGNIIKRHYVGSFVFVEDPVSGEWAKESVGWDEGRIFFDVPFLADTTAVVDTLAADLGYRDCWYATDHLGNVRVVIDITPGLPAPQVVEQSDYLPFGTKTVNPAHASMQANRWRYAGKEEQDFGSLNLGLLDFGARMYDPFTARWTAVDPMASAYYPTTPYSYCASNPISIQDPEGKAIETLWDIASIAIGLQNIKTNIKQGKVGAAVLDGVGIVVDAAAAVAPFIPGGVGAGIKAIRAGEKAAAAVKGADKATDAAKSIEKVVDASKEGSKIVISEGNKIDRSLLNAPNKPGNAPTFKSDGTKVEIHHIDQNPQGPFREMHWSDHRGKGHYKENHPQTNSSNIDRKSFNAQKKEYWKNEYKTNN